MSNHRVLRVGACLQGLQTLPLAGKVVTKEAAMANKLC